jgi:hypothetical protein
MGKGRFCCLDGGWVGGKGGSHCLRVCLGGCGDTIDLLSSCVGWDGMDGRGSNDMCGVSERFMQRLQPASELATVKGY